MVEFTFRKPIEPYEKVTKKVHKKAEKQGEESTERKEDETTELYPIDETIEEEEVEGVLAKYVLIIKIYSVCEKTKE